MRQGSELRGVRGAMGGLEESLLGVGESLREVYKVYPVTVRAPQRLCNVNL